MQTSTSKLSNVLLTSSGFSGEVSLNLPKLNLTGAKETSNTAVPKLIGFYENVRFVPWDDFEDIIADAREAMKKVNAEELAMAHVQVLEARGIINEVDENYKAKPESCKNDSCKDEPVDKRKRFSTCTSVDPVHSIIFTSVVRRLIRGMNTADLHIETKQFIANSGSHVIPMTSTKPTPDKALLRYKEGKPLVSDCARTS